MKKMRWLGKIFQHLLRAGEPKCLTLLTLSCFKFNSCLFNVQTDLYLILRFCICSMFNIKACFLLYIFSSYGFFLFSKQKDKISLLFLKFRYSIYWIFRVTETYHQCELCLEKKKMIYLEIKNLLLSIMHFSDGIYSFKVNNGNTRIMCGICSKLIISDVRWR